MTANYEQFLSRVPFRLMRETVAKLMAVTLPMLATLDAKKLDGESLKRVAEIVVARDNTVLILKTNPSRARMLVLCTAWHIMAKWALELAPEDQKEMRAELDAVLADVAWVNALRPDTDMTKVSG